MSLVSVSNDVRHDSFGIPFALTAEYLSMAYSGSQHVIVGDGIDTKAQIEKLKLTI